MELVRDVDDRRFANERRSDAISQSDRRRTRAAPGDRGLGQSRPSSAQDDNGAPAAVDLIPVFYEHLAPALVEKLRATNVSGLGFAAVEPSSALARLRQMHAATARVDLGRVHPSWWIRALQEESPAVRRSVAASFPDASRYHVQAGLLLDSRDLRSERPASPEVMDWILSLWSERLVGGEAERADDPPAIMVLSRLSLRTGYRLCRVAGLSKVLLANRVGDFTFDPLDRARLDWLGTAMADADEAIRRLATDDVAASLSLRLTPRRRIARLGLLTVARLLADSEPFRCRWALQHWPYPAVKWVRAMMPRTAGAESPPGQGEPRILKAAWERLSLEGRLGLAWPD